MKNSFTFAPAMDEKKLFILEQAAQLFFKHGVKSVTMNEIAAQSGISKKTIYQFFKDKEQLVEEFVDTYFISNPNFCSSPGEGLTAIDRIFGFRARIVEISTLIKNNFEFDFKRTYPRIYARMEQYKRELIYSSEFSIMEQGKKEGHFRPELDSDFVARLSVGRSLFTLNPENGLFDDFEYRSLAVFDRIIDFQMHAICTPQGLAYYKQQKQGL